MSRDFILECLGAAALGDGMLYAAIHRERFRYVRGWGRDGGLWHEWQGSAWVMDRHDHARAAVEDVAQAYASLLPGLQEEFEHARDEHVAGGGEVKTRREWSPEMLRLDGLIKAVEDRVRRLRREAGRAECLAFAHTHQGTVMSVHLEEMDLHPWLLPVRNGVVDLRTGELRPGRSSDLLTRQCPVDFHGLDDDAGPWEETLEQIFGSPEMVAFVQRLYGYGLSGQVGERVFVVHYGAGGSNGKDLFLGILQDVMGDFAAPIPSDMLLDDRRGRSSSQSDPMLLSLKGLRLAVASETDEGRRFSAAKVKWITGAGRLIARGLYESQPTRWTPTHLLTMMTNSKPAAPGTDRAFWSRCVLIRHRTRFVATPRLPNERKINPALGDELRQYLPGILAWLVRGCLEWQAQGLAPPQEVVDEVRRYRQGEDYISQWIEACCVVSGRGHDDHHDDQHDDHHDDLKCSAKALYASFEQWYPANYGRDERHVPSRKRFSKDLESTELFHKETRGGKVIWHGIDLKPDAMMDDNSAGRWGGSP